MQLNYSKLYRKVNDLKNATNQKVVNTLSFKNTYSPIITSLVINFLIYFLFVFLITPVYRSNDDIIVNLISAGFFDKESNEFLLFSNILFGKFLKVLYSYFPQFNWYLILLLFTQFTSSILVLYYLLRVKNGVLTIVLYLCVAFIFNVNFFAGINFTSTSIIALIASFIIIYFSINNSIRIFPDYFLFAIFFTVSVAIRKDIFFLFFFLFILIPILYLKQWRKLIAFFLLALVITLSLNIINKALYRKIDNLQLEYDKARVVFQDRNITNDNAALEKMGWSINDFKLFSGFKGIDNKFFGKSEIIQNAHYLKFKVDFKRLFLSPYSLAIYLISDSFYFAISIIFLFALFKIMSEKIKIQFIISLFWVLCFFLLAIILVHYRFYVFYTLIFYLVALELFLILQIIRPIRFFHILNKSALSVLVVSSFLILFTLIKVIHTNQNIYSGNVADYEKKVNELNAASKKFLVVGDESESLFGSLSIFHSFKTNSDPRLTGFLIPMGCFLNSIQFDKMVNGSVIEALLAKKIYVLGEDVEFFRDTKQFIFDHYGIITEFTRTENIQYSKVYHLEQR